MRIVSDGGATSFHAQPNGAPPTVFTMVASGEGWIRFENPEHDFPNQVEYRREGDRLSAWIAGPGPDGAQVRIAFEYRACGGQPPQADSARSRDLRQIHRAQSCGATSTSAWRSTSSRRSTRPTPTSRSRTAGRRGG